MSVAQSAAKGVIDAFIEDVCSLRVDTSVPYQVRGTLTSERWVCLGSKNATEPSPRTAQEPSQSQDPARLPPHPHNESNAAKMQELEESYAACVLPHQGHGPPLGAPPC